MTTGLNSLAARVVVLVLALGTTLPAATIPAEDQPPQHPLFDRLDTNHDGVISLQEWISARHAFLSRRRAPDQEGGAHPTMSSLNHRSQPGSAGAGATTPMSSAATTAGQRACLREDEDRHPLFERIDRNHDGGISVEEWIAFRRAHAGEHRRPGIAVHRR